jgi:hypothetical protein
VGADDVEPASTGGEQQRGLVIGVARPAQRQDAVVGDETHLVGADGDRGAPEHIRHRAPRQALESSLQQRRDV